MTHISSKKIFMHTENQESIYHYIERFMDFRKSIFCEPSVEFIFGSSVKLLIIR